jgi:hypothetical protein
MARIANTAKDNYALALECSFNGTYVYFFTGKPAAKVRMRIASISSGTPNVLPHIAVVYEG